MPGAFHEGFTCNTRLECRHRRRIRGRYFPFLAEQIPSFRRGNSDDFDISNPGPALFGGLPGADRLVVRNPEPPLGSRHVAPADGYLQHGVHAGCESIHNT